MSESEKKPLGAGVKVFIALAVVLLLGGVAVVVVHFVLPNLVQARVYPNSMVAHGALKTIATAQSLLREKRAEKETEPPYGTLAELRDAKLVDEVLGSGTKANYIFEVQPSTGAVERSYLWWATARPARPEAGDIVYFTNQTGVIWYCSTEDVASTLRPDPKTCAPPPTWKPVGR